MIFLYVTDSLHLFLRKCLPNGFVILITKFVRQSVLLSSKNVLLRQKRLIHTANPTSAVLFLDGAIILHSPAEVLYACLDFTTEILTRSILKGQDLIKINNIYCLVKHSVK